MWVTGPRYLLGSTLGVVCSLLASVALGASTEARTYLDLSYQGPVTNTEHAVEAGGFVRQESRFRENGLIFTKSSIGSRVKINPWLKIAMYYAHKDLHADKPRQAHMGVVDIFAGHQWGPARVTNRSGFEWHLTDGFFRYRNATQLNLDMSIAWLSPYVRAEARIDSDVARLNMLDLWAGLRIQPIIKGKPIGLVLQPFYGREALRRGRDHWVSIDILGLVLSSQI